MVEYKKKKLILQSGGTRNYYYKVSSDGKKKQVSKNEYLEKKGGSEGNDPGVQNKLLLEQLQKTLITLKENNSSNDYIEVLQKKINNIEQRQRTRAQLKEQAEQAMQEKIKLNGIHFGTEASNRFLSSYSWSRNNKIPHRLETKKRLLNEKEESAPKFFKDLDAKAREYTSKKGYGVKGPLFNSIKEDLMKILEGQVEMYKYWDNQRSFTYANESTMNNTKQRKIAHIDQLLSQNFKNNSNKFTWEDSFTHQFIHDVYQHRQS
jgi:hypothetical protein